MKPNDTPVTYRAREFATLAGVTVRALHHYDRLGLLKAKRTSAGYRVYSTGDITRLEQIIALKFIGIPLKQIRLVTAGSPAGLATALRAQRQTLEHKRRLLDQAIAAIGQAEASLGAGHGPDAALYRHIIEVIEMQNNPDAWQQKYDDLVQTKIDRLRSLPPGALTDLRAQWTALVADVRSILADAPASPRAQELGTRWTALLAQLTGKPLSPLDLGRHQQAHEWTPEMATFVEKPVWDFMAKVLAARA